jgi:uncharacterized delta-60 repeat protein
MKYFLYIFLFLSVTVQAQFTESWTTTYNGKGDYSDRYTCSTNDPSGNIYLAGYTHKSDANADFLVVKFNASGQLQWAKSWHGSGQGPDIAYAITYKNGAIYAAGEVSNLGVGFDFFTLALNESGDSLWGAHYNDAVFNQYEQARAIAIDAQGNVYVTGESDRDPSSVINDDFLTIKYSSSGTQQWVKRYNGNGNGTDRSLGIAATANGNIAVAGRTDNGGDDDYCTIQYDSNGNQVWLQQFDNGGTDRISAMGADNSNNIYVTGRSDNGNDDDFRTIKYNELGQLQFNVAYDFVGDDRADVMDVNEDGTFAIAGRSDGNASAILNYNYRVVKYAATGAQQWTATYDSPAAADDIVQDIDLSPTGEVLVTGYSDASATAAIQNDIASVYYSNTGTMQWTQTYASSGNHEDLGATCLLDAQNNAWIAGSSENTDAQRDAILLKYSPQGTVIANNLWNGVGDNSDNARKVMADGSGNIYVCGYSVGKDTDRDMFLMKLSSAGDTLWTRKLSGTLFGSDEEANAMTFDASGNIIVSGYTKNSGTGSDITIQKYSQAGTSAWTATYNSNLNESDRSYDVATDGQGNIYITGKTDINASPILTNDEIFTAKYNSNGALMWSTTHAGSNGIDRGRKIHVGASGSVYVSGYKWNATHDDIVVIKYNNSGAQQWIYTYNSAQEDVFKSSVMDADENLYLLADSHPVGSADASDVRIIKVSNAGTESWSRTYASSNNTLCTAEEITVNSSGDVAVIGSIATQSAPNYSFDGLTLKYSAAGDLVWENQYNAPAGLDDIGDAITFNADGDVLVACHTNQGTNDNIHFNLTLLALDGNSGTIAQSLSYSGSDSLNIANDLYTLGNKLIVTGSTWGSTSQRDILVQSYDVTVGLTEAIRSDISIYPNPAREQINIVADESSLGKSAAIYDCFGRLIQTINLKNKITPCSIEELPSGVYTIQFGNNTSEQKRFIKY